MREKEKKKKREMEVEKNRRDKSERIRLGETRTGYDVLKVVKFGLFCFEIWHISHQ